MTQDGSVGHKSYLALAIPLIVSNITLPILGAVDTAVIGRLGDPAYIGGVAMGTLVFNTMYWVFGFLRVSTLGYSAQSLGSSDEHDQYYAFARPLLFAIVISSLLVMLQSPIRDAAVWMYDPEPEVFPHIINYFDIVIWGAPCALLGFVILAWLMGRKMIREALFLQISTNLLNIVLDIVFVMLLDWGVAGVAWATLFAQIYSLVLGFYIISRKLDLAKVAAHKTQILNKAAIKKLIGVNNNLMIRTFCLLAMINLFMIKSSEMGVEMLAVNAVLFQVHYLLAYLFDGLANATGVFAGKSAQSQDLPEFKRIVRLSTQHTIFWGIILALIVLAFFDYILLFFTDLNNVILLCQEYKYWLMIYPLAVGFGLVYYGIFIGVTVTAPVRNSMLLALALYVATYSAAMPWWGNHGLWLAFIIFSLTRSTYLLLYKNRLIRILFTSQAG